MHFIKALLVLAALSASAFAGLPPTPEAHNTAARNQLQRPPAAQQCGRASPNTIDTSIAVKVKGNTFTVIAANFNRGREGSISFSVEVDVSGRGTAYRPATVVKVGVRAPNSTSVEIFVQLPNGTRCNGGATGNRCWVSVKSTNGYRNCMVVEQGPSRAKLIAPTTSPKAVLRYARGFLVDSEE